MSGLVLGSAIIGAGISAGAGMYSARQARKGMSGGGQVITLPQYSFTEPRLRLTSDFISDNLRRLQMGKYPAYYESALPKVRAGMQRGVREAYYGSKGMRGPGILSTIRGTGAALGVGPKATIAQTNKALYDYSMKEREIDEYLTKLGVDVSMQTQGQMLQASAGMPKGPDAVVMGGGTVPQRPNYGMQAASAIGQALPSMVSAYRRPTTPTATYPAQPVAAQSYMQETPSYTPPYGQHYMPGTAATAPYSSEITPGYTPAPWMSKVGRGVTSAWDNQFSGAADAVRDAWGFATEQVPSYIRQYGPNVWGSWGQ